MNRRERLRAQTLQEIEDTSFSIIDTDGVDALSIAALARSMAMSAPALYRYFPSREALLAELITRSYRQLTDAMTRALDGSGPDPQARVRLLVAAYRDWALHHRRRYAMLFGRPGAGPRTPLDEAMALLVDLLLAAGTAPAGGTSGDPTLDGQLREWARDLQRPGTPPRAARAAIVVWTRVHGIVSLELTGMFDNQAVDVHRLIDLEIDDAVALLS
jgi:AcrR family transcriptional regulator